MKLGSAVDQTVAERIQEHISVVNLLLHDKSYLDLLTKVANLIIEAVRNGNKVILFGNGGSAADAQHLTAEMTGRYLRERRAFAAIALTSNTSSLTAIGNDYSFDLVFARQMEALGNAGDVAIAITTSGSSINVIRALEVAKAKCLSTVVLTGTKGTYLKSTVDYCIAIPSAETPRIQEAHILTGHLICELVENGLLES